MKKVYLVKIASNGLEFFDIFKKREDAIEDCIRFLKTRYSLNENSEKLKLLKISLKEKSCAYKIVQDSDGSCLEVRCDIFEKYIIS